MSILTPYIGQISSVEFRILGDEDIERQSNVLIASHDTFASDKTPKEGGIVDAYLGTIDYAYNCMTCHNNKTFCPGHKGHMHLNFPVFNPLFIDTAVRWLKIICHNCKELIKPAASLTNTNFGFKTCDNPKCGHVQPRITKSKPPMYLIFKTADGVETKKYPFEVRDILESIPDRILEKLNVPSASHPSKFIIQNITVTSVTTRPDIKKIGGGSRSSNDRITVYYHILANRNNKLPASVPAVLDDATEKIYKIMSVCYYSCVRGGMNNGTDSLNVSFMPTAGREETAKDSILNRLGGKHGYIRGNMLGKSTFYMMRSVITGDPTIKVDDLYIPFEFAQTVQIPETVQHYNYEIMRTYFLNGKSSRYPRCVKIDKKATGTSYFTNRLLPDIDIEIGDVIWRDLIDGDEIIFNRQPSLYYASMNKHRIKVSRNPKYKTFRMSELACAPYNADFDGDQMNANIVPSIAGRAEINEMSSMANWFISYQRSEPHFTHIQDSIIGLFLLTRSNTRLDKYHAMRFFNNTIIKPDFSKYPADHMFTGRELISMVLPNINYTKKAKFYDEQFKTFIEYDPTEIKITIKHGILEEGVLDGAVNGMYTVIENAHGSRIALDTMFNLQQLAIEYITVQGFTAGVGDIIIPKPNREAIKHSISKVITESKLIANRLINNEIIPPLGLTREEFHEKLQMNAMRQDLIEHIMHNCEHDLNGLFKMIAVGSKGKLPNLQNINGNIGQITVKDKRMLQNFSYKRTSPYAPRFDTDPQSRGYVTNSYTTGLTVAEFLVTSMSARIDLLGKSLGTAISGAQSRISVKNLEAIVISNNRFCEKTEYIVQFRAGDCGFDPRHVENVIFNTIMISDADLEDNYHYNPKDKDLKALFDAEFAQIKQDRDTFRAIFTKMETISVDQYLSANKLMPVNVQRYYSDILYEITKDSKLPTERELADMVKRVTEFYTKMPYIFLNEIQERKGGYIQPYDKKALVLLSTLIRAELCATKLAKITSDALDAILLRIRIKLLNSLLDYGTPVGIISAVCMSEPTTQLSLDSIHLKDSEGGSAQKLGMFRIKEVLSARPTEKCTDPWMFIQLKEGTSEERAREIANNIEMMEFGKFVESWQIFFEEYGNPIHPDYTNEKKMFEEFHKMPTVKAPADLAKWCTRYVLNRYTMLFKNMSLDTILSTLRRNPYLFIVHTDENAPQIILRIYYRSPESMDLQSVIKKTEELMEKNIRGVPNIRSAAVDTYRRTIAEPNGELKAKKGILMIRTTGVNMVGIFALQNKITEIDYTTIQTDAVRETEKTFGIEAARMRVIVELRRLLTGLNYLHYSLFADEMTALGRVTAIERSALASRNANPLLQMANAMPLKVLERAALNNSKAKIDGVSPYLMVGTTPKIGTTYNTFYINESFIKQNVKSTTTLLEEL